MLLADDHTLIRAGIRGLLEGLDGVEVAGEAGDGHEVLRLARELHPDVVLLDIGLTGLNGLETAARMARIDPAIRVVNLLMSIEPFIEVIRRRGAGDEKLCGPAEQILASWLPRVREEVRGLAEERTLEVQKPDALTVLADAGQLSQVVMNLVANARDATQPTGAITIGATRAENVPFLRAQLADLHGRAALFVRDDGSGIAPTARERIFEPLFTTRGHGHGPSR